MGQKEVPHPWVWRGLHSGLLPAQAEAEVLVKEQGLGDPAWSNPTSDLWLPEPSLPLAVVPLALTGGALLGGMAASRETVTVTPGSPEEWAQARADAGKHQVAEGKSLAPVHAGLGWPQPVPPGNLQWMPAWALPGESFLLPKAGGVGARPSRSWN